MAAKLRNSARPLNSYGGGGPCWGPYFMAPDSYNPGVPFYFGIAWLLGTLLHVDTLWFSCIDLRYILYIPLK